MNVITVFCRYLAGLLSMSIISDSPLSLSALTSGDGLRLGHERALEQSPLVSVRSSVGLTIELGRGGDLGRMDGVALLVGVQTSLDCLLAGNLKQAIELSLAIGMLTSLRHFVVQAMFFLKLVC